MANAETHILLTTLGAGGYKPVIYRLGDHQADETQFFPVALIQLLNRRASDGATKDQPTPPIKEVVVALTDGARDHANWTGLKQELERLNVTVKECAIKDGFTDDEAWQVFDAIGEHLPSGATVTLDVTHGFRSLPLLMLLAVAYLRRTKPFNLHAVYYGAYKEQAPVSLAVELTPFLTLVDWSSAVDAFTRAGDLQPIAQLVEERNDAEWRRSGAGPRTLQSLADKMKDLSENLKLGRLTGIQEGIEQLETSAGKLNVQKEDRWSRPLAQRLDAIVGQFQSLRRGGNTVDDQLAAELRLIEWYFEKGQVLHAGLLLREWLISVFLRRACPDAGAAIFSDGKLRETGEKRLNALANQLRSSPPPPATTLSEPVEPDRHVAAIEQTTSIPDSLRQLWDGTVEMRNDLAHFGHRKKPLPADSIRRQIHERLGIANALLAETQ